ncbi:hypothetical protein BT63DRAFT_426043 [Microthyrium microscopicum]|uniref:Uncharacterized protein n=1 Tax=Microthyrium microscopicum TaxID=703497 RepID=A0A6A6UAY9_9PEZI|nr:hypothetical protein BT63DRAFT_426043 [Microthyrium microscopicum]
MISAQRPIARAAPQLLAAVRQRSAARPTQFLKAQTRLLSMRPTGRTMREKEDENRAHTVTQRLGQWRKIPVELYPIGVVLAIAIAAAIYSLFAKLRNDKTLRLWRKGKPAPSSDH